MHWIVGDIHGMAEALETLIAAVRRRDGEARFVFAGDYCDRGPNTKDAVDLLLQLRDEGVARFVRGNHDEIFDVCLNHEGFASGATVGGPVTPDIVADAAEMFLGEGLIETLMSYGADLHELGKLRGDREAIQQWVRHAFDIVPDAHKQFFRALPAVVEDDDFAVTHAVWPPDYADDPGGMNGRCAGNADLRHDVLWARYTSSQIVSEKQWKRTIYVGHTPTSTYFDAGPSFRSRHRLLDAPGDVIFGEKLVLTDTGCFAPGGRLSAVCHETRDVLQVHRTGDLITD